MNGALLRPLTGVRYRKIAARAALQAERSLAWARQHSEPNAVVVAVNDLLSRLAFGVESERFEEAWRELGESLGFDAQGPKREFGKGPDGLWVMPDRQYLLAAAKSMVRDERQQVYQSKAKRFSNSVNWFGDEYGDAGLLLVLIHPTNVLADSAYPPPDAVGINREGLGRLHRSLTGFAAALATRALDSWSAAEVGQLLSDHDLIPSGLRRAFCAPLRRA